MKNERSTRGTFPGVSGLVLEEPLLFEKSAPGRTGFSLPRCEVPEVPPESVIPAELLREDIPGMPELYEVEVVRHYTRLSQWNYGVDSGFYPLGSCTMKYNPKINEVAAALPGFSQAHPYLPEETVQGLLQLMYELEEALARITGLDAVSLHPAAGAHGEFTGLRMIRAYHEEKGNPRKKVIIPDSAHGTNPASATLSGYEVVVAPSGKGGILEPETIERLMDEEVAAFMVTNPNTLGLFETHIVEIAEIVHARGGLVYCDGANMNAMLGVLKPGKMGVDVLHLNLHKTFTTPHGGGGPGAGPVAVRKCLEPFLPLPRIVRKEGRFHLDDDHPDSIGKLRAFYGNFGILVRAYTYIREMGAENLARVAQMAVLNANYLLAHLEKHYHVPYPGRCMHECVLDDHRQQRFGVTTLDIAKRLIDLGFHPPTIYFPLIVHGALMIEPTETESKETLDLFIAAMEEIAREAKEDPKALKEAPIKTRIGRLDEARAARHPILRWKPEGEES